MTVRADKREIGNLRFGAGFELTHRNLVMHFNEAVTSVPVLCGKIEVACLTE